MYPNDPGHTLAAESDSRGWVTPRGAAEDWDQAGVFASVAVACKAEHSWSCENCACGHALLLLSATCWWCSWTTQMINDWLSACHYQHTSLSRDMMFTCQGVVAHSQVLCRWIWISQLFSHRLIHGSWWKISGICRWLVSMSECNVWILIKIWMFVSS